MEKIKLRFDRGAFDYRTEKLKDIQKRANEVARDILIGLGIEASLNNIIETVKDPDWPRQQILEKKIKGAGDEIERTAIEAKVNKFFKENTFRHSYRMKGIPVSEELKSLLFLDKEGKVQIETEKIRESCWVSITDPAEIEAYKELKEISDKLQSFCKRANMFVWDFDSLFQVDPNEETIVPNPNCYPYSTVALNSKKQ